WLTNGTSGILSDLRVQNCVMLKGADAASEQRNQKKNFFIRSDLRITKKKNIFCNPNATAKNKTGDKWIITAWEPCDRAWGNAPCPCLHSDPKFPDCAPGKTERLQGWLSFYEGTEIDQEFRRIAATKWSAESPK